MGAAKVRAAGVLAPRAWPCMLVLPLQADRRRSECCRGMSGLCRSTTGVP